MKMTRTRNDKEIDTNGEKKHELRNGDKTLDMLVHGGEESL